MRAQPPASIDDESQQRRLAIVLLQVALEGAPNMRLVAPDPNTFGTELTEFYRRALALRDDDVVLRHGDLEVVHAADRVVAFRRVHGSTYRLVAFNVGDEPAFLALDGNRAPIPLWPIIASRPDVDVPGLVALFNDDGAIYGLRVPPRTTVVYRPVAPDDVRPRGLDE